VAPLAGNSYAYAIIGARKGPTGNFLLAAVGEYATVFSPTSRHSPNENMGTDWYFEDTQSMGFMPLEAGRRLQADSYSGAGSNLRLSWHLTEALNGGYRAGDSYGDGGVNLHKVVMYCH